MGYAYSIRDQAAAHFMTFTVHQWVDVFTRERYREIVINSLKYCQDNKGLEIYGWVIMSNHIHLIARAENENLSDIVRDFKKFTAKAIYTSIEENSGESRKAWLLKVLKFKDRIWFWEEGYHGEEIVNKDFFYSKVDYIHANPVKAGLVEKEEDYLLSSAGDLRGIRKGMIELTDF